MVLGAFIHVSFTFGNDYPKWLRFLERVQRCSNFKPGITRGNYGNSVSKQQKTQHIHSPPPKKKTSKKTSASVEKDDGQSGTGSLRDEDPTPSPPWPKRRDGAKYARHQQAAGTVGHFFIHWCLGTTTRGVREAGLRPRMEGSIYYIHSTLICYIYIYIHTHCM